MKFFSLLLISVLFCSCYVNEEDLECYESSLFAKINLLTKTYGDSILFVSQKHVKFNEYFICLDSNKSSYFSSDTISQLKNFACSNGKPLWYLYRIMLNELTDEIDFHSNNLNLVIANSGEKLELNISEFINTGEITNIILEQDTAYWFNQNENPIRPFFPDFDTPILSRRLGCQENFCFASIPIHEKEFCFEK